MKRAFDTLIEFRVILSEKEYTMVFSTDWRYKDMLDFMLDTFAISEEDIVEVHNNYIKRFKVLSR